MVFRAFSTATTWVIVIALGLITGAGGRARGDQITGIVSFGDSLSDVGNDFIASGGTQPSPAADYSNGRFTNGGNWLDYLAHDLGVVACCRLAGGSDYAFGGASTGSGTTTYVPGQAVPNVDTQIAVYLSTHTPTSGELFTIWAGANNLLIGNQTNPLVPAQDIANEITTLAAAGAKQFLVPDLPLLGQIPAASGFTAAQQQALNAWSIGFNQGLSIRGEHAFGQPGSADSPGEHPGIVSAGSGEPGELWVHQCHRVGDQLIALRRRVSVLGPRAPHHGCRCAHRGSGGSIGARAVDVSGFRRVDRSRGYLDEVPRSDRGCRRLM